jgi:hypothetical protein
MAYFYAILAIVGWVWTLLVLVYVGWRWSRGQSRQSAADHDHSKEQESKAIP